MGGSESSSSRRLHTMGARARVFSSVGVWGVCLLQAKQLVSRVVTQNICQYRSLQYSRQEGTDGGLPEEVLFGASWCL